MRYLAKKFSTPHNSRQYVENWDAIFGEKKDPEPQEYCSQCGSEVLGYHRCESAFIEE